MRLRKFYFAPEKGALENYEIKFEEAQFYLFGQGHKSPKLFQFNFEAFKLFFQYEIDSDEWELQDYSMTFMRIGASATKVPDQDRYGNL